MLSRLNLRDVASGNQSAQVGEDALAGLPAGKDQTGSVREHLEWHAQTWLGARRELPDAVVHPRRSGAANGL